MSIRVSTSDADAADGQLMAPVIAPVVKHHTQALDLKLRAHDD